MLAGMRYTGTGYLCLVKKLGMMQSGQDRDVIGMTLPAAYKGYFENTEHSDPILVHNRIRWGAKNAAIVENMVHVLGAQRMKRECSMGQSGKGVESRPLRFVADEMDFEA
jgi:hypothetical protein